MSGWHSCDLCGAEVGVIELRTVRVAGAQPGREFAAGWRCVAREACRARVEASGRPWPIADAPSTVEGGHHGGFTDGHRRAFEAARRYREQASTESLGEEAPRTDPRGHFEPTAQPAGEVRL